MVVDQMNRVGQTVDTLTEAITVRSHSFLFMLTLLMVLPHPAHSKWPVGHDILPHETFACLSHSQAH